jgi:hypothetical protein
MPESSTEKQKGTEDLQLASQQKIPLIFISHDSRDADLAEAFSKLLSAVSAGVLKSFRSSDRKGSQGIEYGVEWYPELMKKLGDASDVVCLLTQRSLDRPWILYEAGVAKGKLDTAVYGIALGIPLSRANSGPFAQFQNCDDGEESLTKLVIQLVQHIPNAEPDHDVVQMQVKMFKQKTAEILKKLGDTKDKKDDKATVDETSVAKLFEEVKLMFKDLPARVESRFAEAVEPIRRRRMRRFDPMMIEELLHISSRPGDPSGLLIALSFFKDDFPWLYEIGMDTYRAIKTGDPVEIERAIMGFRRTMEFMMHGPLDAFIDSKETYMMVRELPRILERYVYEYLPSTKKASRKEKKTEE